MGIGYIIVGAYIIVCLSVKQYVFMSMAKWNFFQITAALNLDLQINQVKNGWY